MYLTSFLKEKKTFRFTHLTCQTCLTDAIGWFVLDLERFSCRVSMKP